MSESLHFIGLALLVGCVGLVDLRLLGVAKPLPVAPLNRLAYWGIVGFVLNLITGILFFAGAPNLYATNPMFLFKILFIALAGLNVAIFYGTGIVRTAEALGAGDEAPLSARIVAGTSLFLWVGVMFLGRMLAYPVG